MADIQIREARISDISNLIAAIRPADLDELTASHGQYADLQGILEIGLRRSLPDAWAMHVDGDLWLMGGVSPAGTLLGGTHGVPWMLGTRAILTRPGVLTRAALRYFGHVKSKYPELSNYVDARNTKSIRWIKRMGFTMDERPVEAGPDRMLFYRFWMKN